MIFMMKLLYSGKITYLPMSNDPYKGAIIQQGYLFGLVAGNILEIKDYNDLIKNLPFTVQITNTF